MVFFSTFIKIFGWFLIVEDDFFTLCLTTSFSSSVIVFSKKPKLCWKYLILLIKTIWLPLLAKFMLVGFLSPVEMSVVLQEPTLTPFRKKKKIETKKVVWNHAYLITLILLSLCYSSCGNILWCLQLCVNDVY